MLRPCEEIARGLGLSVGAAGELDFMVPGAGVAPLVDEKGVCSSYALPRRTLRFCSNDGKKYTALYGLWCVVSMGGCARAPPTKRLHTLVHAVVPFPPPPTIDAMTKSCRSK